MDGPNLARRGPPRKPARAPQNVRDDRPRATFADAYRVATGGLEHHTDHSAPHRPPLPVERVRFLNSRELQPYPITTVIDLLGILDGPDPNPVPMTQWAAVNHAPHVFKKSRYKNPKLTERDVASDPNWIYIPLDSNDPKKRLLQHEAVMSLNLLLDTITHGKLQRQSLEAIKTTLDFQALRRLHEHQNTLAITDRRCFVQCIAHWYLDSHEEGIRLRNHALNPLYYHPADSLNVARPEFNYTDVMRTFTEHNVNSWSVQDPHDPSIVYDSNGGTRFLDPSHPNVPFDQRKVLEFPAMPPRLPQQPGFVQAMEVIVSLVKQSNLTEDRYREWVKFGQEQIKLLGEERLTSPGDQQVCILRYPEKTPLVVMMQIKEDPEQVIKKMCSTSPYNETNAGREDEMRMRLKEELIWQLQEDDSAYWKWNVWKRDLELRALRREISDKLKRHWKFFLQHLAPTELNPITTHCAHPCCEYHEHKRIPPGTFRLNFLDTKRRHRQPFWLPDLKDDEDTPGRAEDDQMWFCLTCIEGLFNGDGLITSLWYDDGDLVDTNGNVKSPHSMMHMEVSTPPEFMWNDPPTQEIEDQWQQRINEATASALRKAAENSPKKRRVASGMSMATTSEDTIKKGSKRASAVRQMEDDNADVTPSPVRKLSRTDLPDNMEVDQDMNEVGLPTKADTSTLVSVQPSASMREGVNNNEQNGSADLIDLLSPERRARYDNENLIDLTSPENGGQINPAIQPIHYANNSSVDGAAQALPPIVPPPKAWPELPASRTAIKLRIQRPSKFSSPQNTADNSELLPSLPIPPRLTHQPIPEGMSPSIFLLYDKVEPEMRYTPNTYSTLSPYENHALTMWKNMCIRKCIFDVPQNRKFFLKECCGANPNDDGTESGYDFFNYWGPDCLDAQKQTCIGFVIEGRLVRGLEEVGLRSDDVGDVFVPDLNSEDHVFNAFGLPQQESERLSESQHKERLVRVMLEDVSYLDRNETSPFRNGSASRAPSGNNNNRRVRVVKPLSKILTELSKREQLAWKKVGYVPGRPWDGVAKAKKKQDGRINMFYRGAETLDFLPIEYRDWPVRSVWQKELLKERMTVGMRPAPIPEVREEESEVETETETEAGSEGESEKEN